MPQLVFKDPLIPHSNGWPVFATPDSLIRLLRAGRRAHGLRTPRAITMAAQAHRDGTGTFVGEEIQKVLIPTPRGVPRPVNKKQRRRMSVTAGPFVDQFERWSVPPIKIAATEW